MLLYDLRLCQPYNNVAFHGGGEYGYRLLIELIKAKDLLSNLLIGFDYDINLPKIIRDEIDFLNIRTCNVNSSVKVIEFIELYDVKMVFSPIEDYELSELLPQRIKYVLTLHGTRALHMSEFLYSKGFLYLNKYSLKGKIYHFLVSNIGMISDYVSKRNFHNNYRKYYNLLKKANLVITSSNYSKSALNWYFKREFDDIIEVIYPPKKITGINPDVNMYEKDYILMVSANRPEKNIKRVLEVIDELYSKNLLQLRTIVVGDYPAYLKEKLKNNKEFLFLDYVSTDKLESLYMNTSLFIFPSLDEGFGYPPLEALNYGKKVLVSHISSMPEILGESAFYLNPLDRESIAISILQSIDSPNKYLDDYKKTSKRQMDDISKFVNIIYNIYFSKTNGVV